MYKISKEFKFEAAHRLWHLPGDHPCKKLHGHSYRVEVEIGAGLLDDNGFVIDFGELKFFQQYLDNNWDHRTILMNNDPLKEQLSKDEVVLMDKPTTAEYMAISFADTIALNIKDLIGGVVEINVTVWETAKNKATYMRFT